MYTILVLSFVILGGWQNAEAQLLPARHNEDISMGKNVFVNVRVDHGTLDVIQTHSDLEGDEYQLSHCRLTSSGRVQLVGRGSVQDWVYRNIFAIEGEVFLPNGEVVNSEGRRGYLYLAVNLKAGTVVSTIGLTGEEVRFLGTVVLQSRGGFLFAAKGKIFVSDQERNLGPVEETLFLQECHDLPRPPILKVSNFAPLTAKKWDNSSEDSMTETSSSQGTPSVDNEDHP